MNLRHKRAQTMAEFAVLGTLIIIAFAFLINFSERLNREQSYIMQTFRAALREARKANDSASYTKAVFRRLPNVTNPMELGQLQSYSSTASVLWTHGDKFSLGPDHLPDGRDEEKKGIAKYQINEQPEIDMPAIEDEDQPKQGDIRTSTTTFTNETIAANTFGKNEASGTIVTKKELSATDTQTASIPLDQRLIDPDTGQAPENRSFTSYLGNDGKYHVLNEGIQRSRIMQ